MVLRGMERALRIGARQDARAIELVDLAANLSVAFTSGIALSATVLTACIGFLRTMEDVDELPPRVTGASICALV